MRPGDLEPLSPEMESLLAKERNVLPESAELRARVMTRARAAIREAHGAPVRSSWQRRVPLLVAAALLTAFAAAAVAAWRGLPRAVDQGPSVLLLPRGAQKARARALQPPIPTTEPLLLPQKTDSKSAPPERGNVVAAARGSLAGDASDAYALELGLLQRARAGVASGEFSTALEAIAEHQRRFPSGRLREEREALRVKALAGLGRNEEARLAAKRFRERFPQSVLSGRIEESIRPAP
jgi:hypothetical protein